jgi:hypothetical protein
LISAGDEEKRRSAWKPDASSDSEQHGSEGQQSQHVDVKALVNPRGASTAAEYNLMALTGDIESEKKKSMSVGLQWHRHLSWIKYIAAG